MLYGTVAPAELTPDDASPGQHSLLSTIMNAIIVPTAPSQRDYVYKAQIICLSLYFQVLHFLSAHPTRQTSNGVWSLADTRIRRLTTAWTEPPSASSHASNQDIGTLLKAAASQQPIEPPSSLRAVARSSRQTASHRLQSHKLAILWYRQEP